ncbi:MAG: PQQ-binding-like beta-propeller repeat protein [Polyangiales bacterium]
MRLRSADRCLGLLFLVSAGCGGSSGGGEVPAGTGAPPQWGAGNGATAGASPLGQAGVGPTAGARAGAPGTAVPIAGGTAAASGGIGGPTVPAAGSGAVVPTTPGEPAGNPGGVPPTTGMRTSWASFGGDLEHTRSSATESTLTVANAKDLKTAFDIKAPGVSAQPAVYHGVVYWSDWGGIVHATNLADQKEVWKVDNSANGGGYTGSPAVTEAAVYVANRNGLLSALDRATGTKLWDAVLDAGVHTHIWSSPIVSEADGVLIIGIGGLGTRDNSVALPQSQLESFRGWVEGFNIQTGKSMWKVQTTAEPNGAGVSVWSSAALDTTRKLAFIGTGNNYYRPVSELSDSLLAIDYMTGQLKWHSQFTMNDAWTVGTVLQGGVDGDVGATPNLFAIDGKDVVGVGDKRGDYHVRDRETGAVVWDQKLTTGGYQGGVMAPAAYQNGVIYVISNNDTRNSTAFALDAKTGTPKWETDLTDPTFGGPAIGNGVLYVGDQAGNMWALDASSGSELWKSRVPAGRGGGFTLVDGLLLTGYGFHFSESRREPLMGGLMAFSLSGTITVPTTPTMMSDCLDTAPPVTSDATFTNVYQGVLCPSGCTKVCHSSSAEAGLALDTKAAAYQGLVSVMAKGEACKAGGQMLVNPGNPTASLLHGKLAAMPSCGVPMPPTVTAADTPITPTMLEAVRAWIAAGAPNN